ncbi:MAG: hypothetical protein ACR650_17765 [Methylocystis sp.]
MTVSFHYFVRLEASSDTERHVEPIRQDEFSYLTGQLSRLPRIDLNDEETINAVKYRNIVPIESFERLDDRTYFGMYKGAYWGHAYENSARGTIPADSVSLRPFYFLLYLSESGRVYLATQYLGQYGAYTALKATVQRYFREKKGVEARSFRLQSYSASNLQPKEVRVGYSRKTKSITDSNPFTRGALITFKKQSRDDGFEEHVKETLFSLIGRPRAAIKEEICRILRDEQLIDVSDDDITDCTIVAHVNGQKKNIYLLQEGAFATQFPISVSLNSDGHPVRTQVKEAMLKLLKDEIISRSEDV